MRRDRISEGEKEGREMSQKFEAVNREQLVARLGRQCSPMAGRDGYVIGPDTYGTIRHWCTCFSIGEARIKAANLNKERAA